MSAAIADLAHVPAKHIHQLVAADFFVVPTVTGRLLFVLVILAHDRRRIVHVAVTAHPTAGWTAQQLRDAFPWDTVPRFLLTIAITAFTGLSALGLQEVRTAPRSPWQNAYVERFIGSLRRECLDHVIIFNAAGLRRVLNAYMSTTRRRAPTRAREGRSCAAPRRAPFAGASSPCRKSAASTIATNVAPPSPAEIDSHHCVDRWTPRLRLRGAGRSGILRNRVAWVTVP